jgi:hypothetical protein
MAAAPWIIDTWVNLIRPAAPERRAAAENVFGRYGALDVVREGTKPEALLAEMDAAGVALGGLCSSDLEWTAEVVARHPDRFFGIVSPDPTDIMACRRTIARAVREHGFKAVKIEPLLWGKPPTDAIYYPIYAQCVDLDVAFTMQIGHTGPLYASEVGRTIYVLPLDATAGTPPEYVDALVAHTFRLLATVTTAEAVAAAWRRAW